MADSSELRGFKWDRANSRLEIWCNGTQLAYLDADEFIMLTGMDIDLTADAAMINFKDGTASTKNPGADAEAGWINVAVAGVTKYIPYYAAS